MLYCTNCGERIGFRVRFCPQCGSTYIVRDEPPTAQDRDEICVREALCEYVRHIPELTRGVFGELENIDRNEKGQLYGEMEVHYDDRFGEHRTARFCAVADSVRDGVCTFTAAGPQRMADFAKAYLAKRTLGFK